MTDCPNCRGRAGNGSCVCAIGMMAARNLASQQGNLAQQASGLGPAGNAVGSANEMATARRLGQGIGQLVVDARSESAAEARIRHVNELIQLLRRVFGREPDATETAGLLRYVLGDEA